MNRGYIYHREIPLEDADSFAKSVDLDQTASKLNMVTTPKFLKTLGSLQYYEFGWAIFFFVFLFVVFFLGEGGGWHGNSTHCVTSSAVIHHYHTVPGKAIRQL